MSKSSCFVIVFSILLFLPLSIFSQFGVRAKYNSNNYNDWSNAIDQTFTTDKEVLSSGYEAGIDYWFRLKKKRIEFLPELFYSTASTSFPDHPVLQQVKATAYGFQFNTQIYALDLGNDCNCPTFSKEGPSINKGFFLLVSPGVMFHNSDVTMQPIISRSGLQQSATIFRLGLGLGVDIGINDLVTITPMVAYNLHSSMDWQITDNGLISSANLSHIQPSIRLGFRPDYGKRRFR